MTHFAGKKSSIGHSGEKSHHFAFGESRLGRLLEEKRLVEEENITPGGQENMLQNGRESRRNADQTMKQQVH
jgi:hypothetical protein